MGLLYPSRKQYDWFRDRQGPAKRLESPITRIDSDDLNVVVGTATQTIYLATAGTKNRLLYLQVYPFPATINWLEVLVDNKRLLYWVTGAGTIEFRWDISDAPEFYSAIQIRYNAGAASSPGILSSTIINSEPSGEGYFVN